MTDLPGGNAESILRVVFYRSLSGSEPVRDWLKGLTREDRKAIGEDIKTAQYVGAGGGGSRQETQGRAGVGRLRLAQPAHPGGLASLAAHAPNTVGWHSNTSLWPVRW
jgi:hypothetical protein